MKKYFLLLGVIILFKTYSFAQENYWQQHVSYRMDIDMDVKKHRYHATQKAVYTNHSPDTLQEIYYHLYWNVFKPNSSLYWHNETRKDPDPRISKLKNLKPEESGDYHIISLYQNGKPVAFQITESILKVKLNEPIAPGSTHEFTMEYEVQIPIIIRRSGRENKEGVEYSMAQWYPKIAEYRPDGWHADPFLGREFFGIWGDFDVSIHIDKNYVVGGSGYLKNEEEIWKKDDQGNWTLKRTLKKKRTWHFTAPDVHDFSWVADPDYVRKTKETEGVQLNFYYQKNQHLDKKWAKLQDYTARTLAFYNKILGRYPYKQYSVIQAGDGGMEYAMCTFISGKRSEGSLIGVMMHEFAHSWFQFLLATDETRHPWMDEGFTTFISQLAMDVLYKKENSINPWMRTVNTYLKFARHEWAEPVSLFSESYISHAGYWVNAYDKGAMFLTHLINIAGLDRTLEFLHQYYETWKFKHPEPADMLKVAEKTTGMELDWFYNEWIESLHTVDYAVKEVTANGDKTRITLSKNGSMPVPLDVAVVLKNNKNYPVYHIPYFRTLKYRQHSAFVGQERFHSIKPWYDGFPEYSFEIPYQMDEIETIIIDPFGFTADIHYDDNIWKYHKGRDKEKKTTKEKALIK